MRRGTWCHSMQGVPLSIRPLACAVMCLKRPLRYSRRLEVQGVCPAATGLWLLCRRLYFGSSADGVVLEGSFSRALTPSCSCPLAPSQGQATSANQPCRSADIIVNLYAYLGGAESALLMFLLQPCCTELSSTPALEQACVMQVHCCSGHCSLPSQRQCPHHLHNSWQPQSCHPHSVPPSLHNLRRHQFQGAVAAPTGLHMPFVIAV